ncbi:hypothetical protein F1559_000886 [Cyanidiococcus yangmingshanensis]|uniref:Uncharacterized protein n=1 Tax=Cyanidiococcus yangmingshanensis TaxID=2690220 RepID=A0A7J7INZ8_9RHOD|nr:hypothetical protein F1559_000886 [Cyanidiococcus yangmingshanensis]
MAALRAIRAPLPQGLDVYASKVVGGGQRSVASDQRLGTPSTHHVMRSRHRRRQLNGAPNGPRASAEREGIGRGDVEDYDEGDGDDDDEGLESQGVGGTGAVPLRALVLPRYEFPHHAIIYEQSDWYRERRRLVMEAPCPQRVAMNLNPSGSSRPYSAQNVSVTTSANTYRFDRRFTEGFSRGSVRQARYADLSATDLDDTLVTALFQNDVSSVARSPDEETTSEQPRNATIMASARSRDLLTPLVASRTESSFERTSADRLARGSVAAHTSFRNRVRYGRARSTMALGEEPDEDRSPWQWRRTTRAGMHSTEEGAQGTRQDLAIVQSRDAYTHQHDVNRRMMDPQSITLDAGRAEHQSLEVRQGSANRRRTRSDATDSDTLGYTTDSRQDARPTADRYPRRISPVDAGLAPNWSPGIDDVTRRYMAAMMDGLPGHAGTLGSLHDAPTVVLESWTQATPDRATWAASLPSDEGSFVQDPLSRLQPRRQGTVSPNARTLADRSVPRPSISTAPEWLRVTRSSSGEGWNHSTIHAGESAVRETAERTSETASDRRLQARISRRLPPSTDSILDFRAWERLATNASSSSRERSRMTPGTRQRETEPSTRR